MTFLFKKLCVEQIIQGAKTATRRPFRPMVKEGGRYHIKVDFFKSLPHKILVKRLYEQLLGKMNPHDAEMEGYTSLEEFREEWESIYRTWDPRQTVWVVEFEYAGVDRNP
ncbi:MAG: ASCH domain-containing protein [Candidatus Bathyarchaeota archaeon]|nr:MAG: ASCH domain-containing protein [Candidatus Bathyarchaeota archaeon]